MPDHRALLALLGALTWVGPARALDRAPSEAPENAPEASPSTANTPDLDLGIRVAETPVPERGRYVHAFGSAYVGRGLRFNNPYRLSTELGDDSESLSLSATYLDLGLGATFGAHEALQHGAVTHLSIATDGIAQEVLSLSYLALYRANARFSANARGGIPVVLGPDLNAGFELAVGGSYMLSAAFGVGAELVGSLFYGAATLEHSASVIPLLSFQAGLWVDYEVLP